jgi:hypothetical protein
MLGSHEPLHLVVASSATSYESASIRTTATSKARSPGQHAIRALRKIASPSRKPATSCEARGLWSTRDQCIQERILPFTPRCTTRDGKDGVAIVVPKRTKDGCWDAVPKSCAAYDVPN